MTSNTNGLVSVDQLLAEGYLVREEHRTDEEVLINKMLSVLGNIEGHLTAIKSWTNTLKHVAKNSFWIETLKKNISEQVLQFNTLCNKKFDKIISGIHSADFELADVPKVLALQLSALMIHYATFNLGKLHLTYPGEKLRDERQKDEAAFKRPLIILQAALVLQGYALDLCEFPDFSYADDLIDLSAAPARQQEVVDAFQHIVPALHSGEFARRSSHLNPLELMNFSKCLRYINRAMLNLLSRNRLPSDPNFLQVAESVLDTAHSALSGMPRDPSIDLDGIYNERYKLVFKDFAKWCQWRAEAAKLQGDGSARTEPMEKLTQMQNLFLQSRNLSVSGMHAAENKALIRTTETRSADFVRHMIAHSTHIRESEINPLDAKLSKIFNNFMFFIVGKLTKRTGYNNYYSSIPLMHDKDTTYPRLPDDRSIPFRLHNYMRGLVQVEELGLRPDNALEMLTHIKLFDWAIALNNASDFNVNYPRTSFEIKSKILQLCPQLKSWEVFMKTVFPQKMRQLPAWLDANNWPTEHMALKAKTVANQYILARSLAERLGASEPAGRIIAVRGNSGCGKSTYMRRLAGFLMKGILNPDPIKAVMKRGLFLNAQVHEEVSDFFFYRYFKEIAAKTRLNFILDTRLIDLETVESDFINPAKLRGCKAKLIDIDVSLLTSLNRVLTREPFGAEPCPSLEAIIDGFIRIRRRRAGIIERIIKEEIVTEYELYSGSRQRLVAVKTNNVFMQIHPELFNKCLKEPMPEEIDEMLKRVIDDAYIDRAIARGDIYEDQKNCLEKWRGRTIKQAVEGHVRGMSA